MVNNEKLIDILQDVDKLKELINAEKEFGAQGAKDVISKFGLELSLEETSQIVEALKNAAKNVQESKEELVEDLENVSGGGAGEFLKKNAWNIANSFLIAAVAIGGGIMLRGKSDADHLHTDSLTE
ncbi:MAG: hypothetical protein RsTaC01_1132 [Candidatus Paraimprobicoccus trichonymphae]|uniref:Uncharacterized protein n=1 Tax=Candidatus Paraimprobicoccus trichonymphae TaxID=3033793 RepID=A0AA48I585_9FIRM|nr:MAG: hypothetical protein RsTaC01_1132 [Candidatus Paraimprobicoccus trichonymphae]